MKVSLPWPDKRLNPNSRTHWRVLALAKKEARDDAYWQTVAQCPLAVRRAVVDGERPIPVKVTFYPPDNRHRDDDNAVSSFKAQRDGIADALKIDDRHFRCHYFFEAADKPGRVEVTLG